MAKINDLIGKIEDEKLRFRVEQEVAKMQKQRKFGLVFEEHLPECTPLFDIPVSRGATVALKSGKISENYVVTKIDNSIAICEKLDGSHSICNFNIDELVVVAQFGEPIYPFLQKVDYIQNSTDSDLWHILIEADNYHALQLLVYLYAGQVDCIYVDPPYNTGARDWKYNNDYVDSNDQYRHSKWLSMIERRLKLAKKLLNPKDSVLIVTIDEKEYLHLGCLLEQLFPDARIQMVSSVIAQSGVARANAFYRTNEFIFFIQYGESAVQKLPLSYEWQLGKKESQGAKGIVWNQLRRTGTNSLRTDRQNLFYPIYFNKDATTIIGAGDPLPLSEHPKSVLEQDEDKLTLWPIKPNGVEGNWQISKDEFLSRLSKGYIKWGEILESGIYLTFLKKGSIQKIENNEVSVIGREPMSGTIIVDGSSYTRSFVPGTQWNIASHDASYKGSQLLNAIIGKRFDFPKSLYAVHDSIRFFVANKPNALIVDFFAGSGTTLHAVNLLNEEDGGNRRCILVTNNEVSDVEAKTLSKQGHKPGDKEWERFGVARYVTWPRIVCSIKGVDIDNKPLDGAYLSTMTKDIIKKRSIKQLSIDIQSENTLLKKQIVSLINDSALSSTLIDNNSDYITAEDATNAILFNCSAIDDFIEEIGSNTENIFVTTSDNKSFNFVKKKLQNLEPIVKSEVITIPMALGFKSNAIFFKLGFLNKTKVAIGREFSRLLSLLWMKSGAHGVCPSLSGESVPDAIVSIENRFAVLNTESAFNKFANEVNSHPEIETVFIITDSENAYKNMIQQLNARKTFQLYRDYLDNFRINQTR